jgi:hypothetical protein
MFQESSSLNPAAQQFWKYLEAVKSYMDLDMLQIHFNVLIT